MTLEIFETHGGVLTTRCSKNTFRHFTKRLFCIELSGALNGDVEDKNIIDRKHLSKSIVAEKKKRTGQ